MDKMIERDDQDEWGGGLWLPVYRIQFEDVVVIQMLDGCTSGISSALIG